jgi:hypothetical protein
LAEKKSLDETTVTWLSSCLMVNFDFDPQVIRYENNFCVKRKWKNTKYSYKIQLYTIKQNLKGLTFQRIDQPIPVLDFLWNFKCFSILDV